MLAILLPVVFVIGMGAGAILALTGGVLANLKSKDRKELAHVRKNLNIAINGLQKAMNPLHNGPLEADIALTDIETNNDNYLKGR